MVKKINLNCQEDYLNDFILRGVSYPLKCIKLPDKGLLSEIDLKGSNKIGWPWTEQTDPKVYDSKINWPKITIVTPSYNQGKFIEETIRSVLLQNYPNLEYIVIDGGSTDNSVEIIKKYAPWISYWQSEKDNGQGQAINLGFSLASGVYYGWLNSDDLYCKNSFWEIAKGFQKYNSDFVYGDGISLNEIANSKKYFKGDWVKERYLFVGGILNQPSCFWTSKIHQPIREELYCAVDSELWFRLIPGRKLKHIKSPIGISRVQPDAKTVNEKYKSKWEADNKKIGEIYQFENKFFLFKYFLSKFYHFEVRLVRFIYHKLNNGKL